MLRELLAYYNESMYRVQSTTVVASNLAERSERQFTRPGVDFNQPIVQDQTLPFHLFYYSNQDTPVRLYAAHYARTPSFIVRAVFAA